MELFKWLRLQWDRVFGAAFVVTGAVALLTGWSKVSATPYPAEQIPYVVSAGLGGLFLLGVGATLWHSADLRDEWRKLDRLEEKLDALAAADDTKTIVLDEAPPAANQETPRLRAAAVPARGTGGVPLTTAAGAAWDSQD
ncbi:MAG TPA: hypothetical protein VJ622_01930 [Acidimicrobiia bacterium]|nr:hypothetical protein [Acidimicrobiia bacterium]